MACKGLTLVLLWCVSAFAAGNVVLDPSKVTPLVHPFTGIRQDSTGRWVLRNARIAYWMIDDLKQEQMLFENDTFENVTFRSAGFLRTTLKNCVFLNCQFEKNTRFVHTILRNNVFLNCRFQKVVFAGGEWVGNRHLGGEMEAVGLGNVENAFADARPGRENTRIDSNEIVGVDVHDWQFGAGFPDAFTITSLNFRHCRLWNNRMGNAVRVTGRILMDSCELGKRAWDLTDGVHLHKSWQGKGGWVAGQRADSMSTGQVQVDTAMDMDVDGKGAWRDQRFALAQKHARNFRVRNVDDARVGSGENILIEDVEGDQVSLGAYFGRDTLRLFRNMTIRRARVTTLGLGWELVGPDNRIRMEDCVFEDLDADVLDLSKAQFVRCRFKNLRIRDKILGLSVRPTFEDCTFENVHRDRGVLMWGYSGGYGNPSENKPMPWESEEEWQRLQRPWWKFW